MSNSYPTEGNSKLGISSRGEVICRWRSRLKPLLLVRALLRKAFLVGISSKEYLILFDVISSSHKSWDNSNLEKALVMLNFLSLFRKKFNDWDSATPPLKRVLDQRLRKVKSQKTRKDIWNKYQLDAFLNVPLKEKDFEMKVFHQVTSSPRKGNRVRNPSAVGTKSLRKFSKTEIGITSPNLNFPKTLEEKISLVTEELYKFLGLSGAISLDEQKSIRTNRSEESFGKDENPKMLLTSIYFLPGGKS